MALSDFALNTTEKPNKVRVCASWLGDERLPMNQITLRNVSKYKDNLSLSETWIAQKPLLKRA
jgi:hypothetical protein